MWFYFGESALQAGLYLYKKSSVLHVLLGNSMTHSVVLTPDEVRCVWVTGRVCAINCGRAFITARSLQSLGWNCNCLRMLFATKEFIWEASVKSLQIFWIMGVCKTYSVSILFNRQWKQTITNRKWTFWRKLQQKQPTAAGFDLDEYFPCSGLFLLFSVRRNILKPKQ